MHASPLKMFGTEDNCTLQYKSNKMKVYRGLLVTPYTNPPDISKEL